MKKEIDEKAIMLELNKLYYMNHLVNNSMNRVSMLLQHEFVHEIKRVVNQAINWTNKLLNISDKFYTKRVDDFEDNAEILEQIIDICMCLDTEEKKIKAVASLKMIVK